MALRARAAFGSGLYLRDIHQEVVWASGLSLEAHLHSTFITSFETSKRILIFVPLYYNPDLDCFTSRQYLTSTLHWNPTQNLDFFNAGVARYGVRSLAFLRRDSAASLCRSSLALPPESGGEKAMRRVHTRKGETISFFILTV